MSKILIVGEAGRGISQALIGRPDIILCDGIIEYKTISKLDSLQYIVDNPTLPLVQRNEDKITPGNYIHPNKKSKKVK